MAGSGTEGRSLIPASSGTLLGVCPDVFHSYSRNFFATSAIPEFRYTFTRGEATNQEMNHTDLTPSLTAGSRLLVVFAQAAVPTHPGVTPLDHPAFREDLELLARAFHHHDMVFHI